MRRFRGAPILLAGLTLLAVPVLGTALAAGPAAATSCVGWPDDVTEQLVRGRLPSLGQASGSEPFADRYDYAVIGRVSTINEVGLRDKHAEAIIDVRAALFQPAEATVTLQMSDAGAMLGYPFELGHTYVVPVKAKGPDGLRNYVMLCDPVREVQAQDVAGLLASARSAGVRVTEPPRPAQSTAAPGPVSQFAPAPADGPARLPIVIGGALVLLVIAAAVLLSRRRRSALSGRRSSGAR